MQSKKPTLTLVCGLPGSGKTTVAKQLAKERDAFRLSPDEWIHRIIEVTANQIDLDRLRDPIEELQWDIVMELLHHNVDVILEWGFWSKQERVALSGLARDAGASVDLCFLDIPIDELWRRISKRNANLSPGTFAVTKENLELWSKTFEPPSEEELKTYERWKRIT